MGEYKVKWRRKKCEFQFLSSKIEIFLYFNRKKNLQQTCNGNPRESAKREIQMEGDGKGTVITVWLSGMQIQVGYISYNNCS